MTIQLYRTPQRADLPEPLYVHKAYDNLTIGDQVYDLSGVGAEPVRIDNQWIVGPVFRLNGKVHVKVIKPYGADEQPVDDEEMPQPAPQPRVLAGVPELFASAGMVIVSGVVTTLELAAQLASTYYEDGWMTVSFTQPQEDTKYLVFVYTDVPAKVEQFKDLGSFELIFSDPATGDPIEPGRIDLQILKVR